MNAAEHAPDPQGPAAVLGQPLLRCLNSGIPAVVGMKMHIGVDSRTGLVHSAAVTAANVHDKHLLRISCTAMSGGSMATVPMPVKQKTVIYPSDQLQN